MKRRPLPTRSSLAAHKLAVESTTASEHHWVVFDHKTRTESGFETETEARTRAETLAKETDTHYRFTVYKVPGRF